MMKKVKQLLALGLALLALSLSACSLNKKAKPASPKVLTVELVPSKSPRQLQRQTRPLEKMLSKQLAMPVRLSVAPNYNSLVEAMKARRIDVGFLPPNAYVLAHQQGAAKLLLQAERCQRLKIHGRRQQKLVRHYRGEILVKKSSKIKSWRALKGKRIAVQNPLSCAGYLFPLAELKEKGLNVIKSCKLVTVAGYDQAVLNLLNGDVDAAFVFRDARQLVQASHPQVKQQLVPIYLTKAIPNDALATSPAVNQKTRRKLARAFISVSKTQKGRRLLYHLYGHAAYRYAKDQDYDLVRRYDKLLLTNKKLKQSF